MADVEPYRQYMVEHGMAANTVSSYVHVATAFLEAYPDGPTRESLAEWRRQVEASHKPGTAAQRVSAINHYLTFLGMGDLRMRPISVKRGVPQERLLTYAAYRKLVQHLREHGYWRDYHAVRLMVTTGLRVGELLGVTVEDVRVGRVTVGEGERERMVDIPPIVAEAALAWAEGEGRSSGPLILNRFGSVITARSLSFQLKARAVECGVDERQVHPEAFRRLFERCFLEAAGDLDMLADLLG